MSATRNLKRMAAGALASVGIAMVGLVLSGGTAQADVPPTDQLVPGPGTAADR